MRKTLLIGVGALYRSDDRVGLLIARHFNDRMIAGLDVVEHHGEGTGLMELWDDEAHVIVVDAAQSGTAPPGTLHEFDVIANPLPASFLHYSSHLFGLAEAVELSRTMSSLPETFQVYAIEGEDFSHGESMTPAVEEAMVALIAILEEKLAPTGKI